MYDVHALVWDVCVMYLCDVHTCVLYIHMDLYIHTCGYIICGM